MNNHAACAIGTFSASVGSASCDLCFAGYYSLLPRQTSGNCSGPCSAPPGSYCVAGGTTITGTLCPQGSRCAGGTNDKVICAGPPGTYCPIGASNFVACPAGNYCPGGPSPSLPCTASPGNYCPRSSGFAAGSVCPLGSFCRGGTSAASACTAAPGSFCAAGSVTGRGVLCVAGYWCAGAAASPAPCGCAKGTSCGVGSASETTFCQPCPASYTCAGAAAIPVECDDAHCTNCATGAGSCTACGAGYRVTTSAACEACSDSNCLVCAAGPAVCTSCGMAHYDAPDGTCVPRRADGAPCAADKHCGQNSCKAGQCCSKQATSSQCLACDFRGFCSACTPGLYFADPTTGACNSTVPAGAPCHASMACQGANATCLGARCCSAASLPFCVGCDALGKCAVCDAAHYASGGVCIVRHAAGASCSSDDACSSGACRAYRCCSSAVADTGNCAGCDQSGQCTGCTATAYVNQSGYCVPKRAPGAACASGATCASNACLNATCCAPASILGCSACDGAGKCAACASGMWSNASGACNMKVPVGASCASSTACAGASGCLGRCCSATVSSNCTACDANGACMACAAGSYAASGVCAPTRAAGSVCSTDRMCQSGACRSARCCAASVDAIACSACSSRGGACVGCAVGFSNDALSANCVPKAADGSACTVGANCTSGTCLLSTCCSSSVVQNCISCDAQGRCNVCLAGYFVDVSTGGCLKQQAAGAVCPSNAACASNTCITRCCVLSPSQLSSCSSCNGAGACATCTNGTYLAAAGRCVPQLLPGRTCSSSAMCTSSVCAASVCCDISDASVRNGGCGACGAANGGACTSCAPAFFYNTTAGECVRQLAPGAVCATNVSCLGGSCLGGQCCSSAAVSGGTCIACASDGSCAVCSAGQYVTQAGACGRIVDTGDECDVNGACPGNIARCLTRCCLPSSSSAACLACDGSGACTRCDDTSFIRAGVCVGKSSDGALCGNDIECDSGGCRAGICCSSSTMTGCVACSVYAGACVQCDALHYDDGAGTCLARKLDGGACSGDIMCVSSACEGGHCCSAAAVQSGSCERCNGAGACVECTPGYYADMANGTGTCLEVLPAGDVCQDGSNCASGVCFGTCCTAPTAQNCTACGTDGACVACAGSLFASNGVCVPKTAGGTACTLPASCRSGMCQGDRCCGATVVSGSCLSCGISGLCELCAAGWYMASSVCVPLGVSGTVCSAASQCLSGTCAAARCCSNSSSTSCNACDNGGQCTACAPGFYVAAGGVCSPVVAVGATCSLDAACGGAASVSDSVCKERCCATDAGHMCTSCGITGLCATCAPNYYPVVGKCTPQVADGTACASSSMCRSGTCSTRCCAATAVTGCIACNADGACEACSSDYYLSQTAGACTRKGVPGSSCTSSTQCATHACSASYCCRTASIPNCLGCDAAGACALCADDFFPEPSTGTCQPIGAFGDVCDTDVACPGALPSCHTRCCAAEVANCATCDPNGACVGCVAPYYAVGGVCVSQLGAGATCHTDTMCLSGACAGAVCCEIGFGLGAAACSAVDGTDVACAAGYVLEDGGTCAALLAGGAACSGDLLCPTQACLGGFCCNSTAAADNCVACAAMTGLCAACEPTFYSSRYTGHCAPIGAIGDPCEGDEACPSSCRGGRCCGSAVASSSAVTACDVAGHASSCASGYYVRSGECAAAVADGAACFSSAMCMSIICQNNFCCASTVGAGCTLCNSYGSCTACNTTHYLGNGTCLQKKAGGVSCESSNECAHGGCMSYSCCNEGVGSDCAGCNALGGCSACATVSENYVTAAGVCKAKEAAGVACGANSECAGGSCLAGACCVPAVGENCSACALATGWCSVCTGDSLHISSSGVCEAPELAGGVCGAASDCVSGQCSDGHCCSIVDSACERCGVVTGICTQCGGTKQVSHDGKCVDAFADGASCVVDSACASQRCGTSFCCSHSVGADCGTCNEHGACTACKNAAVNTVNASGVCVPKTVCASNGDCASGTCQGGFCCNALSSAGCLGCNADGQCTNCTSAYFVMDGACTLLRGSGGVCSSDNQCESLACVGACCAVGASENCDECSSIDGSCTICANGFSLRANGTCASDCRDANCLACSTSLRNMSCTKCVLGLSLSSYGTCGAPPGYSCASDGDCASFNCQGGSCCAFAAPANPTCNECATAGGTCLGCASGSLLDDASGVCHASDGTCTRDADCVSGVCGGGGYCCGVGTSTDQCSSCSRAGVCEACNAYTTLSWMGLAAADTAMCIHCNASNVAGTCITALDDRCRGADPPLVLCSSCAGFINASVRAMTPRLVLENASHISGCLVAPLPANMSAAQVPCSVLGSVQNQIPPAFSASLVAAFASVGGGSVLDATNCSAILSANVTTGSCTQFISLHAQYAASTGASCTVSTLRTADATNGGACSASAGIATMSGGVPGAPVNDTICGAAFAIAAAGDDMTGSSILHYARDLVGALDEPCALTVLMGAGGLNDSCALEVAATSASTTLLAPTLPDIPCDVLAVALANSTCPIANMVRNYTLQQLGPLNATFENGTRNSQAAAACTARALLSVPGVSQFCATGLRLQLLRGGAAAPSCVTAAARASSDVSAVLSAPDLSQGCRAAAMSALEGRFNLTCSYAVVPDGTASYVTDPLPGQDAMCTNAVAAQLRSGCKRACVACPTHCSQCNVELTCTACEDGYATDGSGGCSNCASGYFQTGAGECSVRGTAGAPCTADAQCASLPCVDSTCCAATEWSAWSFCPASCDALAHAISKRGRSVTAGVCLTTAQKACQACTESFARATVALSFEGVTAAGLASNASMLLGLQTAIAKSMSTACSCVVLPSDVVVEDVNAALSRRLAEQGHRALSDGGGGALSITFRVQVPPAELAAVSDGMSSAVSGGDLLAALAAAGLPLNPNGTAPALLSLSTASAPPPTATQVPVGAIAGGTTAAVVAVLAVVYAGLRVRRRRATAKVPVTPSSARRLSGVAPPAASQLAADDTPVVPFSASAEVEAHVAVAVGPAPSLVPVEVRAGITPSMLHPAVGGATPAATTQMSATPHTAAAVTVDHNGEVRVPCACSCGCIA